MDLLANAERHASQLLKSLDSHRDLLAAVKGLRNGLVYGTRIRFPHALVMVFLFGGGTLRSKLLAILRLTKNHAFNLGRFVFGYKLLCALLRRADGHKSQWHSLVSAFCVGYMVFGEESSVNTQINLYLLSRVVYGLAKLGVEKRIIPKPNFPAFPWFAATVWGLVLWMFEHHQHVLQGSLKSSMTYLYHDSNTWSSIRDFLFQNEAN